ncbi:MAG: cobalt ECF transporter T component CbiQ [Acidaminococcales bacterium]|jgi:cobalt/nickel transport system permease protein|nr:cobalt ECF transporter T component CbiQ [Acidaminococcales bacterium]
MNKIELWQKEIRRAEELARQDSPVHSLHPLAKLITTIFFLFIVISFPPAEVYRMLPLFIYPIFLAAAGNIPWSFLFLRVLLASPFVLFLVLSSLFFVPAADVRIAGATWPLGLVFALNIVLKFILTIIAGSLLLATTGMAQLARALHCLPVPRLFVQQLLILYRYIHVLLIETWHTTRACSLRSCGRGIRGKVWGPLLGQLLLRTLNRCENIHQAMLGRGFAGSLPVVGQKGIRAQDVLYAVFFCGLFLAARFYR